MSKNSEQVIAYRNRNKARLVSAFGGRCGICGYNRCHQAFEFHHLDPSNKDGSVLMFLNSSWSSTVKEVRKCVMLCANCHREVHHFGVQVPRGIKRFDETYSQPSTLTNSGKRYVIDEVRLKADAPNMTLSELSAKHRASVLAISLRLKKLGVKSKGSTKWWAERDLHPQSSP